MGSQSEYERLREDRAALRLQFISTELDLAITFCHIAIDAEDPAKAERNTTNAHRAYRSASQYLETRTIGPQSSPEIDEKLRRLEQLLSDLDRIPRSKE